MPVSINTAALKYRDQQGTYQPINSIKGDNGALNIVAPAYENLTYPVAAGQGCIYNDLYYVAKQDITSQESWTSEHWEQRMIADEVHGIIDDTAGAGDTDVTFSADKLTADHTAVMNTLNQSTAATNSDIGKAHSPKTVVDGKVTEWQYVEVGGGGQTDIGLSVVNGEICVTYEEAST